MRYLKRVSPGGLIREPIGKFPRGDNYLIRKEIKTIVVINIFLPENRLTVYGFIGCTQRYNNPTRPGRVSWNHWTSTFIFQNPADCTRAQKRYQYDGPP
jgi:hypothetical protein